MPSCQRRTASTCPNAYYDNEGYRQSMHLMVIQNYDMLSHAVAWLVVKAIEAKPDASIVVPTGNARYWDGRESIPRIAKSVIIIADAAAWPQSLSGNILAV
jgi:hypothetical protein